MLLSLKAETRRPHSEPHAEAERLRWLQGRLPVPALCYAGADERQCYLLTSEVPGTDASDARWLADPARLGALLAAGLLFFHHQPIAGCPFDQRLDAELARAAANVAAGAVDADDFDAERAGRSPAALLDKLRVICQGPGAALGKLPEVRRLAERVRTRCRSLQPSSFIATWPRPPAA